MVYRYNKQTIRIFCMLLLYSNKGCSSSKSYNFHRFQNIGEGRIFGWRTVDWFNCRLIVNQALLVLCELSKQSTGYINSNGKSSFCLVVKNYANQIGTEFICYDIQHCWNLNLKEKFLQIFGTFPWKQATQVHNFRTCRFNKVAILGDNWRATEKRISILVKSECVALQYAK